MERLEDMPNPRYKPDPVQAAPTKRKKKVVRRKRKATGAAQRATTTRRIKKLPTKNGRVRDHLGRFAKTAGTTLWKGTKTAVKAFLAPLPEQGKARRKTSKRKMSTRRTR